MNPSRNPGLQRALAVTVAALFTANGVVVAERASGKNLRQFLADVIRPEAVAAAHGDGRPDGWILPAAGFVDQAPSAASLPPAAAGATATTGRPDTTTTTPPGGRGTPRGNSAGTTTPATGRGSTPSPAATPGPVGVAAPGGAPATGHTTPTGALPSPSTSPTSTAPTSTRSPLDAALAEAGEFVQQARGLALKQAVPVRILSRGDFDARLSRIRRLPTREQAERTAGILRTLGVIGPEVDLYREFTRMTSPGVLAVYDPSAKELLVVNGDPTPRLRVTLAGELARALDDQWFGITPPGAPGSLDQARDGHRALVEGSAHTVSEAYLARFSAAERSQVEAEKEQLARQAPSGIPPAVITIFAFPHLTGPSLVATLLGAGGTARLDAAYRAPPTTAEQLLDPHRYLAGEGARAVAKPTADGPVAGEGSLGELLVHLMLERAVGTAASRRAASGWGGDAYVTWRDGERTCIRAAFVMDTPDDEAELAAALEGWVAHFPGARADAPLVVTRCA